MGAENLTITGVPTQMCSAMNKSSGHFLLIHSQVNYLCQVWIKMSRRIRWHSWLRHCTKSRKVMGSIPNVVGIFYLLNPSGCTMALGSSQPLTEISARNIVWESKQPMRRANKLKPRHVPIVLKYGSFNPLKPSGLVQTCNGIALPYL